MDIYFAGMVIFIMLSFGFCDKCETIRKSYETLFKIKDESYMSLQEEYMRKNDFYFEVATKYPSVFSEIVHDLKVKSLEALLEKDTEG